MSLFEQKNNVAAISSSFAINMVTILLAVIAIVFSFYGSGAFKKYRRKGYLDVVFFLYFFTIVSLFMTLIFSILSHANHHGALFMRLSMMAFIDNLVQIGCIIFIIIKLSRKAMDEQE